MEMPTATQTMSPWRGWASIIILPGAVLLFTPPEWPRWMFMWVLAFAVYFGCKWLTWRRTPVVGVPWWRYVGYLLFWPGLNAEAFLRSDQMPRVERPFPREWAFAALRLLLGATFFWGISRLVPDGQDLLLGWVGMVGLILMLHFGSFHLLSCMWRTIGVEARPLMNRPMASVSVSEFWGKRWNTAFRDLTHRFLFRPLADKLGPRSAIAATFVFSGLVHDLVISVPASGGYGGPTLFFSIQAVALLGERSMVGKAAGLTNGCRGWLFTILILAGPACWLFHPPFVKTVTFFVNPDQLSLFVTGAHYRTGSADPPVVTEPFASGCGLLAALFGDLDRPKAMIGATDIAMRKYLPPDILAFTVTKPMYEQLCALDEHSFLGKPFWEGLQKARGRGEEV